MDSPRLKNQHCPLIYSINMEGTLEAFENSDEEDTIPDEEFQKYCETHSRDKKLLSWPNLKETRNNAIKFNTNDENHGPNINLKLPKRSYSSNEEKRYFYNKINIKKKTELCKNWSLYNACYFKNNCSFAHGEHELRNSLSNTEKYKTKICKMFSENLHCNYGNRCIYLHTIRNRRLFNYKHVLERSIEEYLTETRKLENINQDICKVLQVINMKKQYKVPRLRIFEKLTENIHQEY